MSYHNYFSLDFVKVFFFLFNKRIAEHSKKYNTLEMKQNILSVKYLKR